MRCVVLNTSGFALFKPHVGCSNSAKGCWQRVLTDIQYVSERLPYCFEAYDSKSVFTFKQFVFNICFEKDPVNIEFPLLNSIFYRTCLRSIVHSNCWFKQWLWASFNYTYKSYLNIKYDIVLLLQICHNVFSSKLFLSLLLCCAFKLLNEFATLTVCRSRGSANCYKPFLPRCLWSCFKITQSGITRPMPAAVR